jgi:hypothetical protein
MSSRDASPSIHTAQHSRTPGYHFPDEEVAEKGVRMLREDFEGLMGDMTKWMERGRGLLDCLEMMHGDR